MNHCLNQERARIINKDPRYCPLRLRVGKPLWLVSQAMKAWLRALDCQEIFPGTLKKSGQERFVGVSSLSVSREVNRLMLTIGVLR